MKKPQNSNSPSTQPNFLAMIKDPKKFRKSEDFQSSAAQNLAKIPQTPPVVSPKVLATERKNNIFEEYRQKEIQANQIFEPKKPIFPDLKPLENPMKQFEKMSPITNLLAQEGRFQTYDKGSTAKKFEVDQAKQIKNFFKEKEKFGVVRNSPEPKKDWGYLKIPGAMVRSNDENVFFKNGVERINADFSGLKYSKILLLGLVFCVVIYSGLFGYHFFKAETKIFCKSFGEKDCSPCPEDGKCQNGLLICNVGFKRSGAECKEEEYLENFSQTYLNNLRMELALRKGENCDLENEKTSQKDTKQIKDEVKREIASSAISELVINKIMKKLKTDNQYLIKGDIVEYLGEAKYSLQCTIQLRANQYTIPIIVSILIILIALAINSKIQKYLLLRGFSCEIYSMMKRELMERKFLNIEKFLKNHEETHNLNFPSDFILKIENWRKKEGKIGKYEDDGICWMLI